jgi:hypothetical protein
MPQDANGTEIHVGDIVTCRFRVTNVVADSEKLNLLVEHFKGHRGLPDDYRLALESRQVDVVQSEFAPEPAQPEPKAEHKLAAGGKEHAKETHEHGEKPEHEGNPPDKKHAKETR